MTTNTPSPNDTKGQKAILMAHLKAGKRITVLTALQQYGVYALSQRLGELRRKHGIPIKSKFIKTHTDKWIKEYWLDDDYIQSQGGQA